MPLWERPRRRRSSSRCSLKTNNKIDGVVAANDGIAGAVVATLKAKGLKPIPLSGQDATVRAFRTSSRAGRRTRSTSTSPTRPTAAAAAAVALFKGRSRRTVNGKAHGKPSYFIPVTSITKANYTRLFTDKFLKRSEVCSGEFKQYCK